MAFLFSSSHLPASRVRRPALEDDDHDENPEAMPRSGGVQASSHLEERVAEPETARSAGGSPAPRRSGVGIDWMARLKELAEQQQQRRRADSAASDSGPRRADEEHEPDEGKAHRDERDEGQEQPQGDPHIVEHDLSADSFASRTPVMVRSRLFEMRSAPNAFIKQKQQVRGNNQLTKSQSSSQLTGLIFTSASPLPDKDNGTPQHEALFQPTLTGQMSIRSKGVNRHSEAPQRGR